MAYKTTIISTILYLCRFFDIPKEVLPEICSSSEIYGEVKDGVLKNIPISGVCSGFCIRNLFMLHLYGKVLCYS